MPWFKVDDHFSDHPVVYKAGDFAMGYWLRLGCWLARFPEQGDVIPKSIAKHYGTRTQLRRLIEAELLVPREDGDYTLNASMSLATSGLPGRLWSIEANAFRKGIPGWLRAAVYDRDGRACLDCGLPENLTLDHIYPHSLGGNDTMDNLQTLCQPCNSKKGARV